jgi:hypothetical protein
MGLEKNKGVWDWYHDFFQLSRLCQYAVASFGDCQAVEIGLLS